MIDENVMEKIIPIPDEAEVMEEIQEQLEEEGFMITNFSKGGVFYTIVRIMVYVYLQILGLAREITNACFMKHTSGDWADIKAADYGKYRKEAKKAKGYVTLYRSQYDFSLIVKPGHMFKTAPDIHGKEKKFLVLEETVLEAGTPNGKVLVEAEEAGTGYNLIKDRITVSMIHLEGVERVTNEEDWLQEEGTDEETDESLSHRCTSSFAELAERTIEQKLKNAVESVNGVVTAQIDAQHPRGQGTVDIYVTGSAGSATEELLKEVAKAIEHLKGNYEDYLVKSSEVVRQDFDVTIWLAEGASRDGVEKQVEEIVTGLLNMNRKELNRFYLDSLIQNFAEKITDYRTADIRQPASNVLLEKEKVIVLGEINVEVKNIGEESYV